MRRKRFYIRLILQLSEEANSIHPEDVDTVQEWSQFFYFVQIYSLINDLTLKISVLDLR